MIDYEKLLNELSDEQLESLIEEFDRQMNSDDESWRIKAWHILITAKKWPEATNDLLMTLCGWSLDTLLTFANIIPDTKGIGNMSGVLPCAVCYKANDKEITRACEVNLQTFEVRFTQETLNHLSNGDAKAEDMTVYELEECENLHFPNVCPKDERENHISYLWYDTLPLSNTI